MLNRRITFGGEEIPAFIASDPHIIRPTRKMTVTPIAGTNREVVEMEDAWETYEQPYSLFLGDGTEDSIQEQLDEVARILYKTGWQILLDDYEPKHYRLAYYRGGFDTENKHTRLGKFNISFVCRPERYLKEGNDPIEAESGDTITNPTQYASKPLIHITGSGSGSVTIGGTTMAFTGLVDFLNIDSDKMDVYRQPTENKNSLMTGKFPVIPAGDSTVTFTGGIRTVTITPRFWEI